MEILVNKRNKKYFQDFLEKWNKQYLSDEKIEQIKIKFYDRIHNTSTLSWFWEIEKILIKIDETIEFFLPIDSIDFIEVKELLVRQLLETIEELKIEFTDNHKDLDKKITEIKKFQWEWIKVEKILEKS